MPYLFTIILLVSLVFLIVGLINPRRALFWNKQIANRGKSSLFYGMVSLFSLASIGLTAPDVPATEVANSTQPTYNSNLKQEEAKAEEFKIAETGVHKIHTQRDMFRELAKDCDTSYKYSDDSTQFDHDTGWIVAGTYQPWYGNGKLNMGTWEIPTYNTTSLYDIDENKKLKIYQKVLVKSFYKPQTKKSNIGFYTVSPVGSTAEYIVDDNCFTVKDLTQCSLVQKAKNGFVVKAIYKAPADPKKRAQKGGGNEEFYAVNIASGSIVLPLSYDVNHEWIWGNVYDKFGKDMGTACFYESTLTEVY